MDISSMQVAGWESRYYGMNHAELERRRDRVRDYLRENDIGILIGLDLIQGGYFQWFLGAGPSERPTEEILLFPADDTHMRICLTSECFSDEEYENYQKTDAVNSQDTRFGDAENVPAFYYRYVSEYLRKDCRVAVLNLPSMRKTVKEYLSSHLPGLVLIDASEALARIKMEKSQEERRILRESAAFHDRLFYSVGVLAIPGRTEKDFVSELRYRAYQMGCGGEDVMRTAVVHFTSAPEGKEEKAEETIYPGRILREGDRLNLKVHCVTYDDFYGVLGRTFVLGKASDETLRIQEALAAIQDEAAAWLRPGMTLAGIAEKVQEARKRSHLPCDNSNFLYSIGHMAGEAPNLAEGADWPLTEGMVIAIAPEYATDTSESMYLADMYEVTAQGGRRMNAFPRSVMELLF